MDYTYGGSTEPVQQIAAAHGWGYYAVIAVVLLLVFWIVMSFVGPIYGVWAAHKAGEADLARAKNEENIQIARANSRLAAAELNKRASVIEAEAASAQISAIGEHLKSHPLYLSWQWIEMMKDRSGDTIYVPTEANLPVLEAARPLDKTA